jgi:hypothetical protein
MRNKLQFIGWFYIYFVKQIKIFDSFFMFNGIAVEDLGVRVQ